LLGAYYVALLAAAIVLRLRNAEDCGCFGARDKPTPITAALITMDAVLAVAAALAAIDPRGAIGGAAERSAAVVLVSTGLVLLLTYLAYSTLTWLPALARARREVLEL
jgi:hypothetical protein